MNNAPGPSVPFSDEIHAQKYRGEGESFRDAMNRVAAALKDSDAHYHEFRDMLLDMRFMPAGRVQAAMGATRVTTPYNCYVSGTIEDSFVHGDGSIMDRAKEAAATMRLGGGIGYDFSTLRPRGATIRKLNSASSGPIGFMRIFNEIGLVVASAGHRRGAQMGVMRVDHPDIRQFIHAKQNTDQLTGFNVSIAVTDEFMEALAARRTFTLRFAGQDYGEVDAQELWEEIMRSTWDWAEPGVLFIDRINAWNNLYYCERIAATNPCGEQPLPPYGACLLGSFNLVKYLRRAGMTLRPGSDALQTAYTFDWEQFRADIHCAVNAMDNVVDRAVYPLPQQEREANDKRRMGLGITALANAGEALGHPYGSAGFLEFEREVLDILRDESYHASALRAVTHGAFPLFDQERYCAGKFYQTLRPDVQDIIRRHGIRNSHLTSIAPTGTISLSADNVSSGIEPVFAKSFERTVQEFTGPRVERIEDYGVRVLGVDPKTCDKVTIGEHLDVLIAASLRVDSAVSKTCNVPADTDWEAFKSIYVGAYNQGAKGCTTYQVGGKRAGILVVSENEGDQENEEAQACYIDPTTGRRECA